MDSHQLIDAQFDRAVSIVQSLPKTSPIQTGYEEKLTMYSLYKQATVGNVEGQRPSVWDMLGRAKWDAWAKHKDLDQYEAKWLYVDALLKVLRKYSDKTVAMDLVRELESYNGDASNLVMSRSFSRSRSSSSSGSHSPGPQPSGSHYSGGIPAYPRSADAHMEHGRALHSEQEDTTSDEDGEADDEFRSTAMAPSLLPPAHLTRPQSSMSSRRYRTPMASMLMSPPQASMSVPPMQPMPQFTTPSAYAGHVSTSQPSSTYPPTTMAGELTQASRSDVVSPSTQYSVLPPALPQYRSTSRQQISRPYALQSGFVERQGDRVIEDLLLRIKVLEERLERMEVSHRSTTSLGAQGRGRSPLWTGRGSPTGGADERWDLHHMGLWAVVLNPLSSLVVQFRQLMDFLAYNPERSPALVIIRRLFLDISFFLSLLAISKLIWRRSGVRRQEIVGALRGLWWAIVGRRPPRMLVDKAV